MLLTGVSGTYPHTGTCTKKLTAIIGTTRTPHSQNEKPETGGVSGEGQTGKRGCVWKSPAVVGQQQIGKCLALFVVEFAEIRKAPEANTRQQSLTHAGVEKAHHAGNKDPFATAIAQNQGIGELEQAGTQIINTFRACKTVERAITKPLGAGDFYCPLPRLKKRVGGWLILALCAKGYAIAHGGSPGVKRDSEE
jgi:hypothetical protein